MAVATAQTLEAFMLDHPDQLWEVHHGQLREKPEMSESHNIVIRRLTRQLIVQLDPDRYEVCMNIGRVKRSEETYYIPDVYVVPLAGPVTIRNRPYRLEVFDQPLPLVAEGWSPSTGDYDVEENLPEYMARGDQEIWRLHPFEYTLTAWRRQPNGLYTETVFRDGIVEPIALPGVAIDLDRLFA